MSSDEYDQNFHDDVDDVDSVDGADDERAFNEAQHLTNEEKWEKIRSLHDEVHWGVESERDRLLDRLYPFIYEWRGEFPNIREVFHPMEIELLLYDCTVYKPSRDYIKDYDTLLEFIAFVAACGFRVEPELDAAADGQPVWRRSTPVHHVARRMSTDWDLALDDLFEIYARDDVNYTDGHGLTHFHAACMSPRHDVVRSFLELGQDPNVVVPGTGESPLHFALKSDYGEVANVRALLKAGADPNWANNQGLTPLNVMCEASFNRFNHELVDIFLTMSEEKHHLVQLDRPGTNGWSPLQWAVMNLRPRVVDTLLDHGADMSCLALPTEKQLDEKWKAPHDHGFVSLEMASGALGVVESLERRGYELHPRDALTIMNFFAKCKLFEEPREEDDAEKSWWNDKEFVSWTSYFKATIGPNRMSIYDFVRLPIEDAAKRFAYSDYFSFAYSCNFAGITNEQKFIPHVCEKMSRGFFRRWAVESLLRMTGGYEVRPIIACREEIVERIEPLMNEDLWQICLQAIGQN